MPNRLLKQGIVDSPRIDSLSAEEEVFFYRLLVSADDFGLMDARHAVLRARCFPLKESLSAQKILNWLDKLAESGLIFKYQHGKIPYLLINNWEQRQRSKARYPAPTQEQLNANVGQLSDNCQSPDVLGWVGVGLGRGKGASDDSRKSRVVEKIQLTENGWTGISEDWQKKWKAAYPAVDIEAELAKAVVWFHANPLRKKSNYARFLASWFTRAQDNAKTLQPKAANSNFAGAI